MKEQLDRIEAKLDKLIKALQEYDGLDEDYNQPKDEYGFYKGLSYDQASWEEEIANKRMDVIGQNGNEGLHYEAKPKPKKKYYKPKNKKK